MSWQTRQLASYIAAGYMTDGKSGNPALDAAQVLAYDEIEAAQIEESAERNAMGRLVYRDEDAPEGTPDVVEIVTQLPAKLPTWEETASIFGDPSKWRPGG